MNKSRKPNNFKKVLAQSKNITYSDSSYWTCDICGGNYETGCQYYDSSECPR